MNKARAVFFAAMIAALPLCIIAHPGRATAEAAEQTPIAPVSLQGPITGGKRGYPYSASIVDLAPYGYHEAEYFVSGRAHAFAPLKGQALAADGKWTVEAGEDLPFTTRILVRKPPAEKFNGTVVVEFMQEYFGSERDTNYRWNAETYLRNGFGWVGVSLHHEGIDDVTPQKSFTYGGSTVSTGNNLRRWDPERYAALSVPNSDLSFDILSNVGRAVGPQRRLTGVDPFDGLKVLKVIAVGNTIAAERLGLYINAVQQNERVFDGFFLQDFANGKLRLSGGVETPGGIIREDVNVPVIVFQTMTAASKMGPLKEGPNVRVWAPSGSSHTTGQYMERVAKANIRDMGQDGGFCPIERANSFPVAYVSGAALITLNRWVVDGKAPANFSQPERFTGPADPRLEPRAYFDANGNVAGGIRTPWVDAPIARYDWRGDCPAGSGSTFAFSKAELQALYGTPKAYVRKFKKAASKAVQRGVLLKEDAATAVVEAKKVSW